MKDCTGTVRSIEGETAGVLWDDVARKSGPDVGLSRTKTSNAIHGPAIGYVHVSWLEEA